MSKIAKRNDDNDDGNTEWNEQYDYTCETLTVLTVDGIVGGKVVSSFWRAGDSPRNKKITYIYAPGRPFGSSSFAAPQEKRP